MTDQPKKKCFVISPIGDDSTPERKEMKEHANLVLEHFIKPALKDVVGVVQRADEISKPGDINRQVLDALATYDLVIADLSYHNANVFYELAIRHMLGKPYVQMIRKGERIPFDVGQQRTIFFDPRSIPDLEATRKSIKDFAEASFAGPVETPLGTAVSVESLKSDDPVQRSLAVIIDKLDQLMMPGPAVIFDSAVSEARFLGYDARPTVFADKIPDAHQYTKNDVPTPEFRETIRQLALTIAFRDKISTLDLASVLDTALEAAKARITRYKVLSHSDLRDVVETAI